VFPLLNIFSGIESKIDTPLTIHNAAKNMRESVRLFQSAKNLRIAVVDGQHCALAAKHLASGYWIGSVEERRVNYVPVQSYTNGQDSVLTRLINAKVVCADDGRLLLDQAVVESKRLDDRKKDGVPEDWRSWVSAHLETIYSQYLAKEDDFILRWWDSKFLTDIEGTRVYKGTRHQYYLKDAKAMARQKPCQTWIKLAVQKYVQKNAVVSTNWMEWIDKEIEAKGPGTDVHRGWSDRGSDRKKVPRELSTALWLLKYGIVDDNSFSTLYGMFSNDIYPVYKQGFWNPEYLTTEWVNEYIVFPITQIVAVVASGSEATKEVLTTYYINEQKFEVLITIFREAIRTALTCDILECVRHFGPDPRAKQDRVRFKLEE